jgi:hypothetical protein
MIPKFKAISSKILLNSSLNSIDSSKIVKNIFFIQYEKYKINSDCKKKKIENKLEW